MDLIKSHSNSVMDIVLSVLLVYFFYNVDYVFLGFGSLYFSIAIFGILYFYLVVSRRCSNFHMPLQSASFIIMTSIFFLSYSLNAPNVDTHLFKIIVGSFFAFFIVPNVLFSLYKEDPLKVLRVISYAGIINGFFIVSMFVFNDFKIWYQSFIISSAEKVYGAEVHDSMMSLRMIGIDGFSAYSTSVKQSFFAFIYGLYVYLKRCSPRVVDDMVFCLLIFSAILSARTGLFGLLFFSILYVFSFGLKRSLFLFGLFLGLIAVVIYFVSLLFSAEVYEFFSAWFFDVVNNGGNVGSLSKNLEMYIFGFYDFSLLGDFRWFGDDSVYYMGIDVGWYRYAFAVGYLGTFALVMHVASFVFPIRLVKMHVIGVLLFMALYIFIVMFKGAILADSFVLLSLLSSVRIFHTISPRSI